MKTNPVKGCLDYLPKEAELRQQIIESILKTLGFTECFFVWVYYNGKPVLPFAVKGGKGLQVCAEHGISCPYTHTP